MQQTAVVTGGESGIGRATAVRLARDGFRVFVGDLRLLPENAESYEAWRISRQICDVQREADIIQLIDTAVAATGRLDVLVNNAGVALVKPITEVTEAEWDRCLNTNLKGAFFGCKHAIPHLRNIGGGSVVNIASNAGLLPRAHDPVYSISKLALVGLTKSLALCHGPDRIRINAVCPGPVGDTQMVQSDLDQADDFEACRQSFIAASPLARAWNRMISADEIADAVAYLVSPGAKMVTGTCLAIDGGKSLGVPPR